MHPLTTVGGEADSAFGTDGLSLSWVIRHNAQRFSAFWLLHHERRSTITVLPEHRHIAVQLCPA